MAREPGRVKTAPPRLAGGFAPAVAPVAFLCDGAALRGLPGESLAAALAAAGAGTYRTSGAARGLFCGMGVCRECLVSVDGVPNVRACMTALEEGMRVGTVAPAISGTSSFSPESRVEEDRVESPEVLVVGGGPAGLQAALTAARAGAQVVLLDERADPGGQYFKPLAPSHRFTAAPDRQFSEGCALVDAVRAAGVRCHANALAWGAFPGPEIAALVEGRRAVFYPKRLVLANGAFERAVPLPGWTLPGCMTTGGAQTLARAYRVAPGQRVVIAGNGPLNWQLAVELLAGGVDVALVAEAAPAFSPARVAALARMLANDPARTAEGLQMFRKLRRKLAFGVVPVRVHGEARVEAVTLARIDAAGRPVAGAEWQVPADTLCMGYGFIAASELARSLGCRHEPAGAGMGLRPVRDAQCRSSVGEVFLVGDGAGMGGAAAAQSEGTIAGAAAAADLGRVSSAVAQSARAARSALRRHRRFQSALWSLFRAPPLTLQLADAGTPVCRCENVTLGALREALARGEIGIGSLKRETRAGMGRCQGRYCGALLREAMGAPLADETSFFAPRPPARPVPIGSVARERDEE